MTKNYKQIFKNYILKSKYGKDITKMHYVGPSIVLMMGKILKGEVFKSWNALFVMFNHVNNINPSTKDKKMFNNML